MYITRRMSFLFLCALVWIAGRGLAMADVAEDYECQSTNCNSNSWESAACPLAGDLCVGGVNNSLNSCVANDNYYCSDGPEYGQTLCQGLCNGAGALCQD